MISNDVSFYKIRNTSFVLTLRPYIVCVQYIGGEVFSTSGGYHEYIGGISRVHRGDIMMHVGDIMSKSGDVQYIGGYHEYIRGISRVHRGIS